MRLKHFFLSVIFFFSLQIHGQSLLWQIDGPNMQGPSFLFASIHQVCRDEFRWDKEVMNTIISFKVTLLKSRTISASSQTLENRAQQ